MTASRKVDCSGGFASLDPLHIIVRVPQARTNPMIEPYSGPLPIDPRSQRFREYARQRQMTLADLLLENRIVFLGSSPETGGHSAITDYLANITIQKLLFLQYES